MDAANKMPNGKNDWAQTHFQIVMHITRTWDGDNFKSSKRLQTIQVMEGMGGIMDEAERLTDKFEQENQNVNWGEEEASWYDRIEEFFEKEL